MARRGNSLSITTILKKAQRQGASTFDLVKLTERLQAIARQTRRVITDDIHVKVDDLLHQGIRLHPFTMQDDPFPPMQKGDGAATLTQDRRSPYNLYPGGPSEQIPQESLTLGPELAPQPRRRRSSGPIEDLIPPSLLQKDSRIPGGQ